MNPDQLRRRYLEFFQKKGHKLYPSDSLVPEGDASVLFTGAGMNQFKDAFLGKGPPGLTRATSCQKCLRMPDLDNVGRTASHHTFFEMLGNFSFGDYFKREAIQWASEFLEGELGFPRHRLAVTVYTDDDEAAAIWEKEIGFAKNRIWRFGEKDNFWPAEAPTQGPNGPCGPCSEIYFDFGPEASARKGLDSDPANDGKRFVEIWNLVFTQYDRRGVNELVPLPRKNIDTGMGFERLLRVLEEKPTNFETTLFAGIIARICDVAGVRFGADPAVDTRVKRIADHVRAASFCIADGVRPGNEGRGYVVRKIIRRAGSDLKELGREQPGLAEVVPAIAAALGDAYPELRERQGLIQDTIGADEERFAEVYQAGAERLRGFVAEARAKGVKQLGGDQAFFLWDTIGFPFDIAKRFCEDQGFAIDEAAFEAAMEQQRQRARAGSNIAGDIFGTGPASKLKGKIAATEFTGYDQLAGEAKVLAILDGTGELAERADATSGPVTFVLDRTPFYAESGGQVGDTGALAAAAGRVDVGETKKSEGYHLHGGTVASGSIRVGDSVRAEVDALRRAAVMRNHTATHLLHGQLRRVLGKETTQAGSLVHPEYLRFDYTAKAAPTETQLHEIEDTVNSQVLGDFAVAKAEQSFADAKASGAIALFGEKYGDRVRVVRMADEERGRGFDSVELCGGTHCARTGQIGLFKIVSDGAIAAGVRRIVAVTGLGALRAVREKWHLARELTELLKTQEAELPQRVGQILKERSALEKEIARLKTGQALAAVDEIRAAGTAVAGGRVYVHRAEGLGSDELRALADRLLGPEPGSVALLAGVQGDKIAVVAAGGKDAVKRGFKAGELCKQISTAIGGGGGGRPEMAQGQGKNVAALGAALEAARDAVAKTLSGA